MLEPSEAPKEPPGSAYNRRALDARSHLDYRAPSQGFYPGLYELYVLYI
jgi:hypothetical protein